MRSLFGDQIIKLFISPVFLLKRLRDRVGNPKDADHVLRRQEFVIVNTNVSFKDYFTIEV